MHHRLPHLLGSALAAGGAAGALWHAGRWRDRDWLARTAARIAAVVPDGGSIGIVARNRPQHVAALAGVLAAGSPAVMIHAAQSARGLAADIAALDLSVVLADAHDWSPEAFTAARDTGTAAIAIGDGPDAASVEILLLQDGRQKRRRDHAVEFLSSGTTGAPKRVPLGWRTVEKAIAEAGEAYAGTDADETQVVVHPVGSIAGLAYTLPSLIHGRPLVILDRFEPQSWARAIRDHRVTRGTVPPAGIGMVLDSDVPAAWLESLTLVAVGGGKLDPHQQDSFEARFGVPILPAFGATEFAGVVANWSLELYREWGQGKRGSAGRASKGVRLRTVDPVGCSILAPGEIGLLEAQVDRLGADWIRTTDLASIDGDGFLFLHGRTDEAINRGGFKVLPAAICSVLRQHPAVADAAVVARPDRRLGEVPAAAVELRPGHTASARSLLDFAREQLLAYQVPVEIRILASLPRNPSLKVSLPDVKALLA